jgi:hypothetical protein
MAQSGRPKKSARLSAFGAKRTCGDRGWRIDRARMTQSRHRPSSPTGSNLYSRTRTLLLSHRAVGTGVLRVGTT